MCVNNIDNDEGFFVGGVTKAENTIWLFGIAKEGKDAVRVFMCG